MFEAFLLTTSPEGLQPLGTAAQRSYETVSGAVRDRLGPAHAGIFAEPISTEHGDLIDWYAPMAGTAVEPGDLPQAERAEMLRVLGARVADIRQEAERLAETGAAEDLRLSEALLNATEIPDESMVRAVRDTNGVLHPVLVHWSWTRGEARAVRGVLTAMIPRPEVEPGPAPAAQAGPAATPRLASPWRWLIWLGWLILALLLGLILYLLIAPCGLNQGRLIFCPAEAGAVDAAQSETSVLTDEVAMLRRELAFTDRICLATVPAATPAEPPENEAAGGDAITRRLAALEVPRGALDFALEWQGRDDIDLSVTCPTGATLSRSNRGDCNGDFVLAANGPDAALRDDPLELVVFEQAQPGLYVVRARLVEKRAAGATPLTLHVLREGRPVQSHGATVDDNSREWTLNISISR